MPKGKLKLKCCKIKQKGEIAIYADIFLEDEEKNTFKLHTSSFLFELELITSQSS